MRNGWIGGVVAQGAALVMAGAAAAQTPGTGQPAPWQLGLQTPVTPIAEFLNGFHDWLLVIITAISLFVLALLIYCVVKFNEKASPVPSRTTHNTLIEVAWTVVPVMILVGIAIPSFRLLRMQEENPPADITLKVTGYQWYWGVEYPADQGGFRFDANMLRDKDNRPADGPNGEPRVLAVDNEIVLPVNKNITVQLTGGDVIHAFAMPSFGVMRSAVPGRLTDTWFRATREGVYYGQCTELCGTNHSYMPIAIRIVNENDYQAWLAGAKQRFASTLPAAPDVGTRVAAGASPAVQP